MILEACVHGILSSCSRPYHKPNPFYEKLKLEHKQVMCELKIFEKENIEDSEKLSELTKETVFYSGLQRRLLMKQTQLNKKLDMLRQEKKKLQEDWVLLNHHLEDLNLICKNQDEETSDMKIQQQQVYLGLRSSRYVFTSAKITSGTTNARSAIEQPSKPMLLHKKYLLKEMESITMDLQLMTSQRNELRDRLLFINEGNRPYHKPNPFYEKLKLEHKQIMWELKIFENENTEASKKLSELTEERVFYRGLHSRILLEQTHLNKKVDILKQEKKKLQDYWVLLKCHLEDLTLICKNQDEETSDMKIQQQQGIPCLH
ncbi:putative disks large-like protein [Cricetulus griseus]|uniref:Putative disks large-like protein n=1 Tax=Cricetulus griseus TaxID=10029 RepID=A0A061IJX9_CRIGR|nr:putative disks large-like protein [Cricetulus griseus]